MTITSRHLQTIALDANVLHLHGMAAQQRMDDYLAGWPSAPGSVSAFPRRTCMCDKAEGVPKGTMGRCERCGLPVDNSPPVTPDKAREHAKEFDTLVRQAIVILRRLSTLSMTYGAPAMPSQSSVKQYLTDVEEMIYCPKCLTHGIKEPKEQGRSICREHRDWQERHPGIDKPFKLLDAKARGATKAHMAKLYSEWLRENPQVQPKAKGRKSTKAAERGTDVETVAGMAQRFGGAA